MKVTCGGIAELPRLPKLTIDMRQLFNNVAGAPNRYRSSSRLDFSSSRCGPLGGRRASWAGLSLEYGAAKDRATTREDLVDRLLHAAADIKADAGDHGAICGSFGRMALVNAQRRQELDMPLGGQRRGQGDGDIWPLHVAGPPA